MTTTHDTAAALEAANAGLIVGERIVIGVRHGHRSAAKIKGLSRAERNRLASGRPLRHLPPERVQDAIDRAAGLPRGISAGAVYTIATIDANHIALG